jgi:hypothetical protein
MHLGSREVDYCRDNGCDDHPEELEPVEEREAEQHWFPKIVEWGPEHHNEGDEQQYKDPGAPLFLGTGNHDFSPFVGCANELLHV